MQRILLTGGKGFFGTRLRKRYGTEFEILSTDVQELDILDGEAVDAAFKLFKPDIAVHAAAVAVTKFCDDNPDKCRAINVEGALNIGRACERHGTSMVFLSSEQVFNGRRGGAPFSESDDPAPDTVYGQNKLEAEALLSKMLERLWVLRFTWMFGVPQRGLPVVNNILWDTVRSALKGEAVTASKREFRGLTDIDELIGKFSKVFELPYGSYHIGSRNDLSRYDATELILASMGLGSRLGELLREDTEKYLDLPRDVRLDCSKAAAQGLRFLDTAESLPRCIAEYSLKA